MRRNNAIVNDATSQLMISLLCITTLSTAPRNAWIGISTRTRIPLGYQEKARLAEAEQVPRIFSLLRQAGPMALL
jgi:hypothetical protein